ncbi:MAG: hypothetical protein Q9M92_09545 [Enterobacterales bacterium]|nr:hypothetical protein [Enterobacterales bacterium]
MNHQQKSKSSKRHFAGLLAALLVFTYANIGFSQQTILSVGQQGDTSVSVPVNGLTSDAVLQQFGEPNQKTAAVGEPPISKWIYAKFTVYFENDRVIHSVINAHSKP